MLFKNLKGEEVLDLCAAPGGKTAQLLNAGAKVTALDISDKKDKTNLHEYKKIKVGKNLTVTTADLLKWDSKKYNKIILDAPVVLLVL